MSSDYVGYINLAHIDITSLPLNLGTWTKDDLTVVDIGDGRKGLDVNVKLNRELHIVQDLLKQEIPLSISAELRGTLDLNRHSNLMHHSTTKSRLLVSQLLQIQPMLYYIPAGIFAAGNPAYVQKAQELYGLGAEKLTGLNWGSFVTVNLLPVTIGNIIGGAVMVGGVCFYLHGKAEG